MVTTLESPIGTRKDKAPKRRGRRSSQTTPENIRFFVGKRDCLSQALPFKSFQILGHRLGRVLQALAMIFRRCHYSARGQVEEMKDEFIRVLCVNSKRSDGVSGKVPQV